MDVNKKKKLRNKLLMSMTLCFVAIVLWEIFILNLLNKDVISITIAAISIIGVLLFVLGGIFLYCSNCWWNQKSHR